MENRRVLVEQLNTACTPTPVGVNSPYRLTNVLGKPLRPTYGNEHSGGATADALAVWTTTRPLAATTVLDATMEQGTGTINDLVQSVLQLGPTGSDAEAGRQLLKNLQDMRRRVGEASGVGHRDLQGGIVELGV